MGWLIDADNLSVSLGSQAALTNVSCCVHAGEFIAIVGPNGAGKTTLLKTLLGLVKPTSGTVARAQTVIGYIPQRLLLSEQQLPMGVLEIVQLGSQGDAQRARAALQEVYMDTAASKRLSELSGGQQQRVLIAKALATHPSLLMLDEPVTGIDSQSQAEFYAILSALQRKGIAIMMISHDVDTIAKQVTRLICLNRTILYDGPPEHFAIDQYLPELYPARHRALHHHDGEGHV